MERKFVGRDQGVNVYPPNKNAPSFIKADIVINVETFYEWMKEHRDEKRNVRLQLKEGKSGAYYFELNEWKKDAQEVPSDDPSDAIPF